MEIKSIAGLLSLLILTACQGAGQTNKATQNMEPTEWKFNFFTPRALPARVTQRKKTPLRQVVAADSGQGGDPVGLHLYFPLTGSIICIQVPPSRLRRQRAVPPCARAMA